MARNVLSSFQVSCTYNIFNIKKKCYQTILFGVTKNNLYLLLGIDYNNDNSSVVTGGNVAIIYYEYKIIIALQTQFVIF